MDTWTLPKANTSLLHSKSSLQAWIRLNSPHCWRCRKLPHCQPLQWPPGKGQRDPQEIPARSCCWERERNVLFTGYKRSCLLWSCDQKQSAEIRVPVPWHSTLTSATPSCTQRWLCSRGVALLAKQHFLRLTLSFKFLFKSASQCPGVTEGPSETSHRSQLSSEGVVKPEL